MIQKTSEVKFVKNGANAVQYSLYPSSTSVAVDSNNVANPSTLTCKIKKVDGNTVSILEYNGASDYEIKYKYTEGGTPQAYTTVQVTSSIEKVIWLLYKGSTLVDRFDVPIVKDGAAGTQGTQGARMKWMDWSTTNIWLSGNNGEEWQYYTFYSEHAYMCLKSFTKTTYTKTPAQSVADNDGYFVVADEIFLAFINYLVVNKLNANQIDVDNLIVKQLATDSGKCTINNNGSIAAEEGSFQKSILVNNSCPWGFPEDGFDTNYADNILIQGAIGMIMSYSLPTDISNNGRRLTIICGNPNFASGDAGVVAFSVPTGYYIYENGNASTYMQLSNECVELIGLGSSTAFKGWLVLNRSDYQTVGRYGENTKVLAEGTLYGASNSFSYHTFDGSVLTCSKIAAGSYKISLPYDWQMANNTNYTVMLTGYGKLVASINSKYASYFIVNTTNGSTLTDGSFNFQIKCTRGWIQGTFN